MAETLESLSRGLDVLRLLGDRDDLTMSQIAAELGLSTTRAHRILATLEQTGFVFRSPETRRYRLRFGQGANPSTLPFDLVLEAAYPTLERLRDESGETAHLAMLAGRHIYFIASVESHQPLRVTSRVGRRSPAAVTAAGKVLLAQQPDDQVELVLAGADLEPGNLTRLRKEVREARRTGMARNLGESELGMATLAVPIRTAGAPSSHALSISGPESRINPTRARALTAVEHRHLQLLTTASAKVSLLLT